MNTGDALLEHFLLAFADAGEGCSDRGDPRMAAALILLSSVSLVAVAAGRRYSATRERRLADVAGDGSRLVVDNDSSASSSSSYNYMRPRLAITDRPRLAITWKDHDDADMSEESGDMPDRVEHITEEVMSDNVERTDMASTPTATERGDTRPTISGAVTIIADMVSSAVTFTAARGMRRS